MRKFFATALAVSTLALSACSTQTAYVNSSVGKLSYEESQTFFLHGIGQEKTVDAVKVCGSAKNIAKVESEWAGKNVGVMDKIVADQSITRSCGQNSC